MKIRAENIEIIEKRIDMYYYTAFPGRVNLIVRKSPDGILAFHFRRVYDHDRTMKQNRKEAWEWKNMKRCVTVSCHSLLSVNGKRRHLLSADCMQNRSMDAFRRHIISGKPVRGRE